MQGKESSPRYIRASSLWHLEHTDCCITDQIQIMSSMLFEETKKLSTCCSNEDDMMDHHYLEEDIITDDEATLEDQEEEQLHEKGEDEEWLVLSNSEDDLDAVLASPKNDVAKESKSKASSATETLIVEHHKAPPIDLLEHSVGNVVEQVVEPSIPESKATVESEPKNWADNFAIELPKFDFDFGPVKQWVDRKNFKSWLTTKNVQTLIICLLMSLVMKQRHVANRSTTTVLHDDEVIQRLQQRLVELHASRNEKYASELEFSGLDRCEFELSQLQTLHQELEDSIKASELLAPVNYPTVAHFQEEYHHAPIMGNASQVAELSLKPCATSSYKATMAVAVAGPTAVISV
jgi:hypothetical protein